jgi:hypothetical protein
MNKEPLHTAILIPLSKASQYLHSFLSKSRSGNTVRIHKENVNRTALDINDKEKEHSFGKGMICLGITVL